MSEYAIIAESIGKKFRIGASRNATLRQDLQRILQPKSRGQDFWALQNISFKLRKGEILGLIGANGSGKSTLLKILSQITYPTTGRVELFGRVSSLLEVGAGFHHELTGRENIFFKGVLLGMTREEVRSQFDEIVAFAEVEQFIDTPVKHYSSGMYMRLAFSVSAHLRAEIVLIDEVLAVGDYAFRKKCSTKIAGLSSEGRSAIIVNHRISDIQELASQCILLDKGKISASGSSSEVIDQYLNPTSPKASTQISSDIKVSFSDRTLVDNTLHICSGENLSFSIACPRLDYPVVTIKAIIYDNENKELMLLNSYYHRVTTGEEVRNGVTCNLEKFPLNVGKYLMKIIVKSGDSRKEFSTTSVSIKVLEGDFYNVGCNVPNEFKILVPQRWTADK